MLSIKKLCCYQIRGRSGMYGLSCGFMLAFLLFAVYMYHLWQNDSAWNESSIRLLIGVLVPFFSCFMILPFAEEVMHTDFEETTFPFHKKLDLLFMIQNTVYYILVVILFLIFGVVYDTIFSILYQLCFLCVYLQLFTFAGYFITRSRFATCAILLLYLSVTLAYSMSNNQNVVYAESVSQTYIVLDFPMGYFVSFGEDISSFFKEQGWKMIIAVLAVALSVINRRQRFWGCRQDRSEDLPV